MSVERMEFPDGDLLVAEVSPSLLPPVRYRGRVFVRIGPRRDIASEAEERILTERRTAYMATFDATPCLGATLEDLNVEYIRNEYLPSVVTPEVLADDKRDIKEQLASVRLYDRTHDCPTYAALLLFGKNPRYYLPGAYVQFVRFSGKAIGGEVLNEKRFQGPLFQLLPALESFVNDAIITQRPVSVSLFREKTVFNYPNSALRELVMNAIMHRDYQSNMPIRLYQFDDHIEMMNAGGLYGEARPENFPNVNDYRNPIIAEAMKEMKYVNMFNQGIRRVQDMLLDNGNKEAVFDVSKLTAFAVNVFSTVDVTQGVTQDVTQDVTQGVTQGKKLDIWIEEQIRQNPKITTDELAKLSGLTSRTIKRHITSLVHIKYVGRGYSGHWEIVDDNVRE
jgi:ATP-dependent DNA helicase RecG